MKPNYEEKGIKAYLGDCLDVMPYIEDGSIDLTITSPPYDNLRTYENDLVWNWDVFTNIAKELYRVTKKGGVVVWVVGDATIKGSETGTSFKQALYFKEIGFNLHDTMIYHKPQACFGSNNCYLQSFEYMFVFSKGKPSSLNLMRDRKNVRSGSESMSKQGLSPDGIKSKRIKKKMDEYGKRKNIWEYGVGGGNTGHPAIFPEQLALDHIISWSNPNDVILDPMMGSGTTGKMAKILKRKFIGIEKVPKYFGISTERIQNTKVQGVLNL